MMYVVICQGPTWDQTRVCYDEIGDKQFRTDDLALAKEHRDLMRLRLDTGQLTAYPPGDYNYYVAKELVTYTEILI